MVNERQLAASKDIQQRTGKTFHFATRLLPERVRHATYVLYAFFRVADEVVDDAGDASADDQRETLARLREEALGAAETDDPVLAAFQDVRERYDIADEEVEEFVDAMVTDIDKSRYDTYEEVESYMRGSSVAVGLMMLSIMESDDRERAKPHAAALAEAFQMTNFLRDVREDIRDRDRVYLPGDTLERHGVTDDQIARYEVTEGFRAAMAEELHRTERLYRDGVAGIEYLPEDCQFAVLLSAVLYAEHHRLIRARDYDTLSETPQLGTLRKLWLLVRTRWHWSFSGDPEAVFRTVSAVGEATDDRPAAERRDTLPAR